MNICFAEKRNSLPQRQDGIALIELMVAIFVIVISVLALYEMIAQGTGMLEEQRHKRMALERAQAQIETLRFWAARADTIPMILARRFTEYMVPANHNNEVAPILATCTIEIQHSTQYRERTNISIYSEVSVIYSWREPFSGQDESITLKGRF